MRRRGSSPTPWRRAGGRAFLRAVPPPTVERMVRECARRGLRWRNIFNAEVRAGDDGRGYDGSRGMVYGRTDAANSSGAASDRLPALRAWGRRVLRIVRAVAVAPRLRLADVGYIRTDSRTPQHWHRDVPLWHRGAAYSVFMPVNAVCPRGDPGAFRWRRLDAPGRARGMPAERPGDVFVMDSRAAHRGGARPLRCPDRYRYVAFASVVDAVRRSPDYGLTVPV